MRGSFSTAARAFRKNEVHSPAATDARAYEKHTKLLRVGRASERTKRPHDDLRRLLHAQTRQLVGTSELEEPQIVFGQRRERPQRRRIGHAMALRAREVDHHVLAVVREDAPRTERAVQHRTAGRERGDLVVTLE
jgi:hypothetical protein